MSAGQSDGSSAMAHLDDGKAEKDKIPSNRDKAQRKDGLGLDGKGTQVDRYKDMPSNRRSEDL